MTGTDLPTVVRNPKIKVKIKTAPQQTREDRGFTTARKPLTNPTSPVKAGHLARAEVHEEAASIFPKRTRRATMGDMEDEPRYMTTREVAAYFRVADKTVRQWAHDGLLPFKRTPGDGPFRFREADVQALADHQTSRPGESPPHPHMGPGLDPPTNRPEG